MPRREELNEWMSMFASRVLGAEKLAKRLVKQKDDIKCVSTMINTLCEDPYGRPGEPPIGVRLYQDAKRLSPKSKYYTVTFYETHYDNDTGNIKMPLTLMDEHEIRKPKKKSK